MKQITDVEVTEALTAIRGGDDTALEAFVERYDTVLTGIAWKAPMEDKEDAKSIATLALIEALRTADIEQFDTKPAATLYTIVRHSTMTEAAQDRTVTLPPRMSFRYTAILKAHGGDVNAAYAAVAAGGESIDPATFLAAHMATYAHMDRESIGTAPTGDDDEHPAFQIAVEDNIEAIDDRDLVHNHLFPLIDEPGTHDLDIVKLVYGFPEISDHLVDTLADAGFQPGDVMSDVEVAEVLQAPGLGSRTVGKRRRLALGKMREYLDVDAANENN